MIILATNVLSELMRPEPDPGVVAWIAGKPTTSLFTTTVTQAEILYGVALLPTGKRRASLAKVIDAIFDEDFRGRILPFDEPAARTYSVVAARRRQLGRPISQFDAQIAAIALSRTSALATRNMTDFHDCGLELLDPWRSS